MASFPISSALRKQSAAAMPLSSHASQFLASSRTCSSTFSTLCPKARLITPQHPIQSSQRLNSSVLPTQQRRSFLVQLKRQAQSLKQAATPTPEEELPVPGEPVKLQLTNLPYFIRRTASNQLPIYLVTKAGGTKRLTKIQKTEGDVDSLRNDLAQYLDSRSQKRSEVTINRLNGHIIVKGWRKPEIQHFLEERNF